MKKVVKNIPETDWILTKDLPSLSENDKFYAFKNNNAVYSLVRLGNGEFAFVIINDAELYCSGMQAHRTKKAAIEAALEWEFFTGEGILQFDTYEELIKYFFK